MLKYLHEEACPWDEMTCNWAAIGGHLDMLKYAHENGCPLDQIDCRSYAEKEGHQEVLDFLDSLVEENSRVVDKYFAEAIF